MDLQLPSFSAQIQAERLIAETENAAPATAFPPEEYLDLAECILREAVQGWLRPDGTCRDPYENTDRWQGGTAARFACPAAILVRRRGRRELLPLLSRVLDRLSAQLVAGTALPGGGFPPGVLDLMAKEFAVAVIELQGVAESADWQRWHEALRAVRPETAFTGSAKERRGERLTNYEIYAAVAEWLRRGLGAATGRDWPDHFLTASLPLFTGNGLYRDPGDPMLYDLSVRQNLGELLHYGYDGALQPVLAELLRRAGLCTLLMQSPLGWAPYGGRSNLFVHNEAMQAYVCETEARRWHDLSRPGLAAAFRGAARRSLGAIRPFVADCRPPHALKNRFSPATKVGRDSGYGEYAVYSLLAASLLARTYLVADRRIPAGTEWPGKRGSLLNLYPEFHRLFANCGDTQVEMDTQAQAGQDATGIGRIHRLGVPSCLGLSLSVAAAPRYLTGAAGTGRDLALGPAWQAASGEWTALAQCARSVRGVTVTGGGADMGRVEWTVRHDLGDGPVRQVRQCFVLTPGRLDCEVVVAGEVAAVAWEVPCLMTDGVTAANLQLDHAGVEVRFQGARLTAAVPDATATTVDPVLRASREAWYRAARVQVAGPALRGTVTLQRRGETP